MAAGMIGPGADLEALAGALLEAARQAGAEAADALVVAGAQLGVGVRGGALEEAERSESVDFGLRALVGRRQACVSASDPRPATIAELAERAVAMAREAPEDPWCGLPEPALLAREAADLDLEDPADPPSPELLEDAARAAEAAALAVAGVTMTEQASASWGRRAIRYAATNGFSGGYAATRSGCGVSAIAGAGLGMESDHAHESRRWRADLPDPAEIGRLAGERAAERLNPRRAPTGPVPVIFDQRVAASLVRHLLAAASGAAVARGSSWLRGRLGAAILPAGLEIREDPLIARGPASRPFDGEGLAAQAKAVVADGVLTTWLMDSAAARQLGLASTGNASRGLSAPPSVGATNVRLSTGAIGRQALIRETGRGLLVTGLIGLSLNATTGDYSRGASGFWIEGGEIAYPVNEITIAGNLLAVLPTIAPADDIDPSRAVAAPTLRVEGLTVAGG